MSSRTPTVGFGEALLECARNFFPGYQRFTPEMAQSVSRGHIGLKHPVILGNPAVKAIAGRLSQFGTRSLKDLGVSVVTPVETRAISHIKGISYLDLYNAYEEFAEQHSYRINGSIEKLDRFDNSRRRRGSLSFLVFSLDRNTTKILVQERTEFLGSIGCATAFKNYTPHITIGLTPHRGVATAISASFEANGLERDPLTVLSAVPIVGQVDRG